jgi:hypothetical protein
LGRLEVWLESTCFASVKPWVQTHFNQKKKKKKKIRSEEVGEIKPAKR